MATICSSSGYDLFTCPQSVTALVGLISTSILAREGNRQVCAVPDPKPVEGWVTNTRQGLVILL